MGDKLTRAIDVAKAKGGFAVTQTAAQGCFDLSLRQAEAAIGLHLRANVRETGRHCAKADLQILR
ncbi:hypothetical protein [Asticcacaulis biprosthecium]|uniref:hypothetical protein n=1 Tax=Asticcacaulis biprosthecium TaxID=76891 RepID=UPI00145DE2DE|nr:hypothetical protein [Asticcacaulis biprosthecium]